MCAQTLYKAEWLWCICLLVVCRVWMLRMQSWISSRTWYEWRWTSTVPCSWVPTSLAKLLWSTIVKPLLVSLQSGILFPLVQPKCLFIVYVLENPWELSRPLKATELGVRDSWLLKVLKFRTPVFHLFIIIVTTMRTWCNQYLTTQSTALARFTSPEGWEAKLALVLVMLWIYCVFFHALCHPFLPISFCTSEKNEKELATWCTSWICRWVQQPNEICSVKVTHVLAVHFAFLPR